MLLELLAIAIVLGFANAVPGVPDPEYRLAKNAFLRHRRANAYHQIAATAGPHILLHLRPQPPPISPTSSAPL
jgi:hypothetical protein